MPTWPNRPAEHYLAALDDPDPRMRQQACAALEVLREERAVAPLLALLEREEHASVRARASGDLTSRATRIGRYTRVAP
jgi:HEAT repeat protein